MPHYPQSELVRKLFMKGQPLVYGKGDTILGNGPEPDGVYFVESGYVKIYTINDEGDELLHIIYGSGEIFPLTWAYLGLEPELLLYQALATTTVWRIARDWFSHFVKNDVDIGHAMALQMAQQFRIYSDRVDNLEYKRAQERVAYRLLFLASRFGIRDDDNNLIIEAPITHEIFANSINLARESVSREIEKFEREGLIEKTNAHIIIRDVAALATKLSRPVGFRSWNLEPPATSGASSSSQSFQRDQSQVPPEPAAEPQPRPRQLQQSKQRWP